MKFTSETKVRDVVLGKPGARQVLEDAGVDYCCGGGKSVGEACMHAGVAPEEILKQIREAGAQAGPEAGDWAAAPLADLTRHIREQHHRYVREAIIRLQPLLEKVNAQHGKNHAELAEIERLFLEVAHEMQMHMQKEEMVLFPYIESVERSATSGAPLERPFFGTVQNPIHAMMQEHDAAGDLVKQIRKATGQYTPPPDACTSYTVLYQDLRDFEADLHQHVHLENNILFPRAAELEAAAFQRV